MIVVRDLRKIFNPDRADKVEAVRRVSFSCQNRRYDAPNFLSLGAKDESPAA